MTKRKTPEIPQVFSIGWPPNFKSQIRIDKTGKYETQFAAAMRNRAAGGWDSHPIIQPGSKAYVSSGPVGWLGKKLSTTGSR